MEAQALISLCTCPSREVAEAIAEKLVAAAAAACVNILPGLTSVYSWQGKVEKDAEVLLIIKTTAEAYPRLEALVREIHPYELPEIIAVPVVKGLPGYLQWMSSSTQSEDR